MEKMIHLFRKSFLTGLILGVIFLSGCGSSSSDPTGDAIAQFCKSNPGTPKPDGSGKCTF